MANTFKFGNKNWAWKEGSVLAYNDENNNFKPLPFDFTRSSSATRVNKDGLIEVVGSDEPRVDYLNNADGHLLLEPSRSNLVPYSEDTTGYSHYNYGGGLIVDTYGYPSPDGGNNASRLVYTNSSTGSGGALLTQNITLNATGTYTLSLWIKSISGTNKIRVSPKDTGSQGPSGEVFTITNEWQRYTHTFTNDGGTSRGFQFRISETEDSGDRTFDVWGMQIEEGSYATSYIPTSGSSVTRIVDDADNTSTNALSLSNSASFYWNVKGQTEGNADNNTFYVVAFATDSSTTSFSYFGLASTATEWRLRIQDGSTSNFKTLTGISKFDDVKVAVVLNASTYSIYANGVALYTNESYNGTSPTIETIEILSDMGNDNRGVIRVVELKAYNTELTSTEAIALTS